MTAWYHKHTYCRIQKNRMDAIPIGKKESWNISRSAVHISFSTILAAVKNGVKKIQAAAYNGASMVDLKI